MTARVLHVISEMEIGGAETLVRELVLRGSGEAAVASSGGPNAEILRGAGVRTYDVPAPNRSIPIMLRAVLACRAALVDFRPSIVFAHNISATVVGRLAMVTCRPAPMVSVFHGLEASEYRVAAAVLRLLRLRTVAVSETAARRLVHAGLPPANLTLIRNSVPAAEHEVERAQARAMLGLGDGFVAVSVARMVPHKRHDVLLQAWSRTGAPGVLLLAGDGPTRPLVEDRVRALGLGDSVRILGEHHDVRGLLGAADVFVLSTDREGMPVSVLESLAAGVPIVASDVDGASEALAHGGGFLVPPGDVGGLSEALRRLVDDPALCRRYAEEARTVAREFYRFDRMVESYDRLAAACLREAVR